VQGNNRRSEYGGRYAQHSANYGESVEDLLIRRTDTHGSDYVAPGPGAGFSGYDSPMHENGSGAWNSEYDKPVAGQDVPIVPATYPPEKTAAGEGVLSDKEKEAAGMVVHEKHRASVEMVPTTRARRWWVRITWLLTWWVPSFLLSWIGRMKRPDIRMAWREKVAIFMMIIFMCGVVIFYIVIFGRLLCPDRDKAWNTSELAQHAGTTDFYAAIAGKVYDVS
jgi:chitin synthase